MSHGTLRQNAKQAVSSVAMSPSQQPAGLAACIFADGSACIGHALQHGRVMPHIDVWGCLSSCNPHMDQGMHDEHNEKQ